MDYVVMRKDLSSVLSDEKGWMVFGNIEAANGTASNFYGTVKPFDEARKIITLRQKLMRNKENIMAEIVKEFTEFAGNEPVPECMTCPFLKRQTGGWGRWILRCTNPKMCVPVRIFLDDLNDVGYYPSFCPRLK